MKITLLKISIVAFACLWVLSAMIDSALAHRVNVFAWVEGDTVYVESKFAGGKRVTGGKIVVMDSQGSELLSGRTDSQGKFSFKIPKRTDMKIVLIAGQGHQAEWTISASEVAEAPINTASATGAKKAGISARKNTVSEASEDGDAAESHPAMDPKELEAMIERILDRKLKPITKMIADAQQKGPSVKDILAGLGYILGLVGIAAYVQSRKK
jgi:nickel transport protein